MCFGWGLLEKVWNSWAPSFSLPHIWTVLKLDQMLSVHPISHRARYLSACFVKSFFSFFLWLEAPNKSLHKPWGEWSCPMATVSEFLTLPFTVLLAFTPLFHLCLSGNPLQFSGNTGSAGQADLQRCGRRFGWLVWLPSGLPPVSDPVSWNGPSRVDGHFYRCSEGAPAQRSVQVTNRGPGPDADSEHLQISPLDVTQSHSIQLYCSFIKWRNQPVDFTLCFRLTLLNFILWTVFIYFVLEKFATIFITVRLLQQILLLRIYIFTSETCFFCMKELTQFECLFDFMKSCLINYVQ